MHDGAGRSLLVQRGGEVGRLRRVECAGRPPIEIAGSTAIVVDDGIATGATMRVAVQAARKRNPARLVLATPVAPKAVFGVST